MLIVELKKSDKKTKQPWYFTITDSSNGEVLATSEMYSNRGDAIDTMHRFREGTFTLRIEAR